MIAVYHCYNTYPTSAYSLGVQTPLDQTCVAVYSIQVQNFLNPEYCKYKEIRIPKVPTIPSHLSRRHQHHHHQHQQQQQQQQQQT